MFYDYKAKLCELLSITQKLKIRLHKLNASLKSLKQIIQQHKHIYQQT